MLLLLPTLSFGQSDGVWKPQGVVAVSSFWTGVASLVAGTGFGVDLAVRQQPPRWNEPALTGGLIAGGVVLVAVAAWLMLSGALGSLFNLV
ncbi:MAG: hypothetical protein QM723_14530 [Myxococcaceae bacterium]